MNKIIKFGADWCKPCEQMDKILKDIESDTDIVVEYVDIEDDSNAELVTEHSIRSIPTMLFYKDNVLINRVVGTTTKTNIVKIFE